MILAGAVILATIQFNTADIEGGFGIALVGMITVFTGLVALVFMLPALERWIKDRFGLNRRRMD